MCFQNAAPGENLLVHPRDTQVSGARGVPGSVGEHRWNEVPEHLSGAALDRHLSRRDFLRRAAYTAGIGMSIASAMPASTVLAHANRAHRSRIVLPDPANMEIDHFVILMMENRSFDHYFGWYPGADASQHQTYVDPDTGKSVDTRHASDVLGQAAQWQGCGHPDPDHGWTGGRQELQNGFLAGGNDEFALTYYNEGELGFIHPAAKAFQLYDNYFCSLLGPTWPNRYYKWSAQSGGKIDNSPPVATAGNQWPTIFDRALANGKTATYYNSDLPFSAVWGARGAGWTRPAAEFYADCAAGTLSNVTIIDPPFRDGGGFDGNSADEHPLGDVRLGQAFMADVAHAFLSSPNFKRGAMFIVYDEWGGFFDHVTPPRVPDDLANVDINQDFGQMGFRTPTVVLSPWTLAGGAVSHLGPLGHESILKLIEYCFGLAPLCMRDANAVNIGESFDWTVDPNTVQVPDLPSPSHIVSKPCSAGGGDITDPNGSHEGDMDALEELAYRFKVPVGEGKPHQIFRAPDSVKKALAASS
jgi:phospholipase C